MHSRERVIFSRQPCKRHYVPVPLAARCHLQSSPRAGSPEQRHKVGEGGQDTRDSHPGHGQPRVSQGTSLLRRRSNDNPQPSSICPRESTGGGVLKHTHLQTTKCSLNIRHHHFTLKSASSIVSLSGLLARILVIACLASLQALGAALRLWHN